MKNTMASERRKAALTFNISEIDQDIESEKKGIAGLENLVKAHFFFVLFLSSFHFSVLTFPSPLGAIQVYGEQPSYTNEAGMITTQRQLGHLQEYMGVLQNNQQGYVDALGGLGGSRPSTGYSPAASSPAASSPMPSFCEFIFLCRTSFISFSSFFFLFFFFFFFFLLTCFKCAC